MPDLLTHCLLPYFVLRMQKKIRDLEIILLGLILPDILSRPFYYILYKLPFAIDFTSPMHSPAVALLYCLLLSFFFSEDQRKRAFFLLFSGSMVHLAMDYVQINYDSNYFPFFPFSWWHNQGGLFWPEDSLVAVPVLVGIFLVVVVFDVLKKRWGKKHSF